MIHVLNVDGEDAHNMTYCELHDEWKQETDTCFDFDKDELLCGFNKKDDTPQYCKNCSNREHE